MNGAIVCIFFFVPAHASWFSYDSGIARCQNGDWQGCMQKLHDAAVDNPEQADLLYDLGVSSFKTGDYEKAVNYSMKAAEHAQERSLRQQAYFNAGNAQVKLNKLQEAIDAYDQVLALDPSHERAAHNKEVVKKMLEQHQQKEQQKKQNDEKKDSKDNNEKDNKQQNDQRDSEEKNKQSGDNSKKEERNSQEDSKKDRKNEEKNDAGDRGNKNTQKNNAMKEKNEDKKDAQKTESGDQKKQDKQENPVPDSSDGTQKLTPTLAHFLQEQEKKDAHLNKRIIHSVVGKQSRLPDGYNNW